MKVSLTIDEEELVGVGEQGHVGVAVLLHQGLLCQFPLLICELTIDLLLSTSFAEVDCRNIRSSDIAQFALVLASAVARLDGILIPLGLLLNDQQLIFQQPWRTTTNDLSVAGVSKLWLVTVLFLLTNQRHTAINELLNGCITCSASIPIIKALLQRLRSQSRELLIITVVSESSSPLICRSLVVRKLSCIRRAIHLLRNALEAALEVLRGRWYVFSAVCGRDCAWGCFGGRGVLRVAAFPGPPNFLLVLLLIFMHF